MGRPAVHPKFRPWKSRGLPVFQMYACYCNPQRTLHEIYPLFLVCKPSLELSTLQEVIDFLLDSVYTANQFKLLGVN